MGESFKILILGEAGVGKTSLVRRYATGRFLSHTTTTIGVDRSIVNVNVDDEVLQFNILDAAGCFGYRGLIKSYMTNVDAVIFVYDLTDKESFASLPLWNTILKSVGKRDITKLLVGNKKDLLDDRQVLFKNARNYAEFEGMVAMEISVKEEDSVALVFQCVAKELRSKKEMAEIRKNSERKPSFLRTASLSCLAPETPPKHLLQRLGMMLSKKRSGSVIDLSNFSDTTRTRIQRENFRWM